ncbi:MAG: WYL domain-containing protein [Brooklawnia sp.]|nr:WYL domain-containing protein [Brooklawnia sp.]
MARRKTERLVNLTILLLSSRRFVSREQIRATVEGYRGSSEEAFQRMFERDKDELRALGVPIETGSNDPLFSDEQGYRISRTDFELPPIEFTPDEATVLGLASTVWQQASMAEDTTHALAKLRAAGIEPDAGRLTALAPRLSAREEAFEPLWQAVVDRQVVQFGYRTADEVRTVEPWRLAWRNNSWYLVGHDRDRRAPRVFKLARMTGVPSTVGEPDAFDRPDEELISRHTTVLTSRVADLTALLAIRGARAPALRRRGAPAQAARPLPAGFHAYRVPFTSGYAAGEIASFGADVVVLEPETLRAEVVSHLRGVLRAHAPDRPEPQRNPA